VYKEVDLLELVDDESMVYRLQGKYVWSIDVGFPRYDPVEESTPNFYYHRDNPGFEEVNAYYHIDTMRRFIDGLDLDLEDDLSWHSSFDVDTTAIAFDALGNRYGGTQYFPDQRCIYFSDEEWDDAEDQSAVFMNMAMPYMMHY